ncbi:MAG: NCS2 family permease, partial [Mycobacteriales bacterium]
MTTAKTSTTPSALDRYFSITARGSTVQRELRGGFTTFFTMAYIVVLNPLI